MLIGAWNPVLWPIWGFRSPTPRVSVWTGSQPIACGTEILLSYGKGFWEARKDAS